MQVWYLRFSYSGFTEMFWYYVEMLETSVRLCTCTKMIWNYVEMAGLVSLHVVFWNFVVSVIISGETTWGYKELQVSCKLEHGPRYYTYIFVLLMSIYFIIIFCILYCTM